MRDFRPFNQTSALPAARRSNAFTLIEVILAVGIFSIVLVALNTVFFAALRLRERTSENLDTSLPLTRALAVLRRDLQNAVAPGGMLAGHFRSGVAGMGGTPAGASTTAGGTSGTSGNTATATAAGGATGTSTLSQYGGLDFFTTTGALTDGGPWAEVQEVNYQLIEPADRSRPGKDLVRLVNRNLLSLATPMPEEERLLGDVEYLEFGFFDGLDWRDTWDTSAGDARLPSAVRIRLQLTPSEGTSANLRREPIELVFLIPAAAAGQSQTSTNSTQAAGG